MPSSSLLSGSDFLHVNPAAVWYYGTSVRMTWVSLFPRISSQPFPDSDHLVGLPFSGQSPSASTINARPIGALGLVLQVHAEMRAFG